MTMNIIGSAELIAHLDNKVAKSDIRRVVKENTAELQNRAQRNAPVDTGNMKNKITQTIIDAGQTGVVTAEAGYSGYVEYGHRGGPAQPFIRPAFYYVEVQFLKDIEAIVKG